MMTRETKQSNRDLNRRRFLGFSAALAASSALPATARSDAKQAEGTSADLPVKPGYQPLISSAWIRRGEHEQSRDRIRQVMDEATDFAWLQKGDRVLVKLALNSGNTFPATSDPWMLETLITILHEKGAGVILVGDQSGVADVHWTRQQRRGSSRKLCQSAGLLDIINSCGGKPVFFEEEGYSEYLETRPEGLHHWKKPIMISSVVERVDHIVYLPRVASHLMGDITSGFKLGVGFLRDDSRQEFHRGGESFYAMYEEINAVPEIKNKLRLIMTSGRKVLSTFGPDSGTVTEPEQGLIFASEDLLANELLSYAWLLWNREHETSALASFTRGNIHRFRSFINKKLIERVWETEDDTEIPEMPVFSAGVIHDHPAIINHMSRIGGKPERVVWKSVNAISNPSLPAYITGMLNG